MLRWFSLAFTLALTACLISGCQRAATPSGRPGWIEVSNSGVEFSMPKELKATDLSISDLDEIQKRAKSQYPDRPEMQKALEELASSGEMKLVATMPVGPPSEAAESMNLVVLPLSGNQSVVDLVDVNRIKMKEAAVPGTLTVELRQYPGGQSAYFQFDVAKSRPSRTQTTYIFTHGGKEYLFTFSSGVREKVGWGQVAEAVAKSVHFE